MILLQAIFELLILSVSGLGSGLFILRNRKLPPLEKFTLSVALSWLLVYLAGTAIYLAHLPVKTHFAVSAISLLLLLLSLPELSHLLANKYLRRTLYGFLILLLWNFLFLCLIRHYSGGNWTGDWYEHFQRSDFFVEYLPKDTLFSETYPLPARPPVMNILCAHVLSQVGSTFDRFEIASAYLNLLIYFPCVLLTSSLARRGRKQLPLLIVLFAFSPLLIENVTYSWTKLFSGFYILLGTWLYLRAYQKNDTRRLIAAFVSLCAGFLVHYSAGPYLLFFSLHYAFIWLRRKQKLKEPLLIASFCIPLLATWFAWSLYYYGRHTTLSSNTTIADSQQLTFIGNLQKIAVNLFYTVVPHPLRISPAAFDAQFLPPNPLGHLRDYWFLIFQPTLPAGMGTLAGLVILYLFISKLARNKIPQPFFWLSFVIVVFTVGVAVHGQESLWGVAHICLLPLSLLGIAFLAANFPPLPLWLKRTIALFAVFDFLVGVLLHIKIEHLYFQPIVHANQQLIPLTSQLLARRAVMNSLWRAQQQLPFWADHFAPVSFLCFALIALLAVALLFPLASATRSQMQRRPDIFFSLLLIFLSLGICYCFTDELDGSAAVARQVVAAPIDELQQNVADASTEISADPNSSIAFLDYGEALYRTGDTGPAADNISQAWTLNPFNPRAAYDALIFDAVGMPFSNDVALKLTLADNVYTDPKSPATRLQLGAYLLQQHHTDAAIAQLRAAVDLSNSNSPEPLLYLGVALQKIGGHDNIQQSIDLLTQSLRLQPTSPQIATALRDSLTMRGDSPADIDAYIQHITTGQ
jgi:tetratricopeptide (TPR) repeat protein